MEKGLIRDGAQPDDQEIFQCIFAPGFSTARKVTEISGRGVGMDVVKKNISSLRGTIEIASKPDVGTQVTLKIPLTLAIIDGLLVRVHRNYYVVPVSMVEECLELTSLEIRKAHGRDTIAIRGSLTPYLRLRSYFRLAGEAPEIEQIVICKVEEHLFGLVVDQVIGKYQTVIKNLGIIYRKVTGISGATVLGDGTVALILDVDRLMRQAGQGPMAEIQEKGRQK